MLEQIFISILITSSIGTALTILLALIWPITKKLFSSHWHYYMWLIVLIVMILPVRFTVPAQTPSEPSPGIVSTLSDMPMDAGYMMQQEEVTKTMTPKQPEEPNRFEAWTAYAQSKVSIIALVWLWGVILLLFAKGIGYMLFLRKLQKNSEVISCPELLAFTDKKVHTRESSQICSPLMIGLLKPTLLLPKTKMTKEELHHVLSHEMTHFKRRDILYKWFLSVVKCVHWFNPAIYFVSSQINMECEISCDLTVVEHMTQDEKISYVNTILMLLSAGNARSIPLTTGMAGNKKTLKRRFMMIKNKPKISKKTMIVSIVLAVLLLFGAVLASGFANGKFLQENENDLLKLSMDERKEGEFNFLVLGLDHGGRADTVMLLSFRENGVTGLSIPRNVRFNEKTISELMAEENGDQKVVDAVREKLSVPITYYATVHLDALKDIVNTLGNVEFDVPQNMAYEDPYQNLHIDLSAGRQSLNGEQASALLQFRGYTDGDMSRIATTQSFIKELIRQKATPENLDKVSELYHIIAQNVSTNYSLQSLNVDIKAFQNIKSDDIAFYTIPGGSVVTENGMFAYEIDFVKAQEILTAFGYDSSGVIGNE